VLRGEFFVPCSALFPQHGEPPQCDGALRGLESGAVVQRDAEVGFGAGPDTVGNDAGADVLDSA
jgi:hypothetical protein